MKSLILAAGLGTRLLPHTAAVPKPLFTLAGRPLVDIHIEKLRAAGAEAVRVNTHHLHPLIERHLAAHDYGIPVSVRFEPAILGTGGAIRNAADFLDRRPFMVVNADIVHAVDLRRVYAAHLRRRPAATLVLCQDPEFDSVQVDSRGRITGFADEARGEGRRLTFTGIQVLDPVVLDYLPARGFSHSVAAFRAMLADGLTLRAFIPAAPGWHDVGTPARYRAAARRASAAEAWRRAFDAPLPRRLRWEPLAGDGSDRLWYRLAAAGRSLVMADHGLRPGPAVTEADAFAAIGRHLHAAGAPVPAVVFADTFAGLVFLEDLGDLRLQEAAAREPERGRVLGWYREVIDSLVAMAMEGARGFDPAWAFQTPRYNRELILERECRYFVEAFLNRVAGVPAAAAHFAPEFERIAENALAHGVEGFMHRDLQSRNIMRKNGRWHFIDFQGGRIGPLQYDLASLLIDPYMDLTAAEQEELLQHGLRRLASRLPVDPARFRRGYAHCALARNLQVLGAFGFLSTVKGKPFFAGYIPAALGRLDARLAGFAPGGFPRLRAAVAAAMAKLGVDRGGPGG
ncbi:MAG: sugar phosphate nucleotidyltransferase [Desulfobacterales bacterium]|jgi:aminoglycoside/choline kinase family phosphotransferase/GTP:adenosylcobinamide-phosphate guanylyltransferase|nr:sugar phosphate nucleotidyltransferase [Desulfobacterales bacterium]